MVLEDSTSDDQFTASSYEHQQQPTIYTPGVLPSHIDPSHLAKIPLLNRFFGSQDIPTIITTRLQRFSNHVGRPLSKEEELAFAEITAKSARLSSYGVPSAAGWAAFRLYATRSTLKWVPFGNMVRLQPRRFLPFWDGHTIRVMGGRTDLLRIVGTQNKFAVMQILRLSSFALFGIAIFPCPFITLGAAVAAMQAEPVDARLKDYMKDHREKELALSESRKAAAGQRSRQGGPRLPGRPTGPDGQGDGEQQGPPRLWRGGWLRSGGAKTRGADVDDASPSGGQGTFDLDSFYEDDEQRARSGQRSTRSMQAEKYSRDELRSQNAQNAGNSDDSYGSFSEMKDSSDPGAGGDAWERVRQGSMEGQRSSRSSYPSSGQQQNQEREMTGRPSRRDRRRERRESRSRPEEQNEYEIRREEEERSYPRSQAQKEFDERVERERTERDFDGGKKW